MTHSLSTPRLAALAAILSTTLLACAEPQTVREEVASELSARPETVVLSAEPATDAPDAAYLNPARDPEGNRYGDDATDAQLSTNNEPGMAEPSKAVDEDARPEE